MNLTQLHASDKPVSTDLLFSGEEGKVISLRILQNGLLKEHITKVPALLVCLSGKVRFENEKGEQLDLGPSDFVRIEPLVKHWVSGIADSQLLLMK